MGRSRYGFGDPEAPHFMTCTILDWTPVFTRPDTLQQKLDYIHMNPVVRGYVDEPIC